MQTLNILGISGSLRKNSFNLAALKATQALTQHDVNIEIADISQIPLYDQDVRDNAVPDSVTTLAAKIMAADAILFSTPEYNYSISGVLKNTIDWLSRESPQPFAGKPAVVMSASMSLFGGARAQYDLRKIMIYMDVHFLNKPEVMIAQAHERFDENGQLIDESTKKHLEKLIVALVEWTRHLKHEK